MAVLLLLLLAGGAFAIYAHRLLTSDFSAPMPGEGRISFSQQEDGALLLSWPAAEGAVGYRVEVRGYPQDGSLLYSSPQLLCSVDSEGASCLLPSSLPREGEVDILIYARSHRRVLGREQYSLSPEPRVLRCSLSCPQALGLAVSADPETRTALLAWDGREGDEYSLFCSLEGGEEAFLRTLTGERTLVSFGEDGDLPVPERGETWRFWLEASRETPELRFPGLASGQVTVCREDLLGTVLGLSCVSLDDSSFLLQWEETKGERYVVERMDGGSGLWQTLAEIPVGEERAFFTGHLPPFGEYRFRVSAAGGQAQPEGMNAMEPEEASVSTAAVLTYAAAWGLEELAVFAAPDGTEKIGTLPVDRAACVLGEENGYFLIATPEGCGYVDGNRCMIDLPDYIGGLCEYRITNSVSSIYTVHGVPMEGMTGKVITGYEAVALPEGGYLVPLLYPTAQKLIAAALALGEDGYRLRIYDSFRPHIATKTVYDLASALLDQPVSEEEGALTYRQLMTGDRYSLWDFLAAGISKHNRGIAVDVALLRIEDGTELKMQSEIHDLSWYASTANNDDNARLLSDYMRAAGFGTLFSEWWHFQDMETLNALEPTYRSRGVTPEGWRKDDRGWRYRCADGGFITGETREIDGLSYTFDEEGYLLPQQTHQEGDDGS